MTPSENQNDAQSRLRFIKNHRTVTKSVTIPENWDSHLMDKLLAFTSALSDPNLKLAELIRFALMKTFPELHQIDNSKSGTLSRDYLIEQMRIFERILEAKPDASVVADWKNLQRRLKKGEFSRKL